MVNCNLGLMKIKNYDKCETILQNLWVSLNVPVSLKKCCLLACHNVRCLNSHSEYIDLFVGVIQPFTYQFSIIISIFKRMSESLVIDLLYIYIYIYDVVGVVA